MRRGGGEAANRPGGRRPVSRGGAAARSGAYGGKKHLWRFSIRPGAISGIREQQLQGQTGYAIYAAVIDQRRFAPLSFSRRGGRVVECTALEMRHRGDSIGGSNPSLSATKSLILQAFVASDVPAGQASGMSDELSAGVPHPCVETGFPTPEMRCKWASL